MRLFIGIPASEVLKNQVDRVLKEKPLKASWVRSENLHITLKFLGEVEEKKAKSIIENFEKIVKPLNHKMLPFEGASSFPNEKKPRVLFLKFFEDPEILNYQRDMETLFEKEGFIKEERDFKVHLTLARFKFPPEIEKFKSLLEKLSKENFQPFEVSEIVLFESILKSEGPVYIKLKVVKCLK